MFCHHEHVTFLDATCDSCLDPKTLRSWADTHTCPHAVTRNRARQMSSHVPFRRKAPELQVSGGDSDMAVAQHQWDPILVGR